MSRGLFPLLLGAVCTFLPLSALRAEDLPPDFQPDARSVQHYGPAYRYPQAGWIVLHVEGEPYERGYQQGRLLAPEIAAYVRCLAAQQSAQAPAEGWKVTRTLVNSLFLRRYDREYLEEMRGIADGASAAGARFDERPIDLTDIVALNSCPELDSLPSALDATPTGLEPLRFPDPQPQPTHPPQPMHCSAFAATGPATADGKIVFGHITMFGLYPSRFYNVWLDLKPAKGHRILMQSYPGGIQSGMDYYLNDAGLLVCETTIAQTHFDAQGLALASRIRQALQYTDSIDRAVAILEKANNGLYTNEWLLGDIKTNEIAMFELGTHQSKLYRSSKNEWFGGTEGFYWGCNNTKDVEVRLETVAATDGRPGNVVFHPSVRDRAWLQLFHRWKGRITADFGKEAFTTPPVAGYHSLDAKFTTSNLARELKTWALFGPPLGRTWKPTQEEERKYPDIRPLVSNPWTVLHAGAPSTESPHGPPVVDLKMRKGHEEEPEEPEDDRNLRIDPPWHGTLLPRTDADIWLATAFAEYEKVVTAEKVLKEEEDGPLKAADRDRLAVRLYAARSAYLAAAHEDHEVPLLEVRQRFDHDEWYRLASGKGVLVLHELRRVLGDRAFTKLLDDFGRAHAGRPVTSAEFRAHIEQGGTELPHFFDYWLKQTGLPRLRLGPTTVTPLTGSRDRESGRRFRIEGEVHRSVEEPGVELPDSHVEISVETSEGEVAETILLHGEVTHFVLTTHDLPRRLIVDRYGQAVKANGGVFSTHSFLGDVEHSLIVYGTTDEAAANREAAEALQQAIRQHGSNQTVRLVSDREVTDDDLKGHHLLLIGRPDSNAVVERCRSALPLTFGRRSFVVRHEAYAHADSAVVATGVNPVDGRYSVTVVAGLSAAATFRAAPLFLEKTQRPAEVLVLAHDARARALVVPAPELVHEFQP